MSSVSKELELSEVEHDTWSRRVIMTSDAAGRRSFNEVSLLTPAGLTIVQRLGCSRCC